MAILLTAKEIQHSFGARPLFKSLNFVIESKDRVGLIGPNGAGKST
ncbi:MAG: ATP-binding cassette domain-containing protein, partial [Proteobacteria bacterium]|nr:ATP-binding cassette domain-containing protein [Pseudomonadota bacterium]